MPTFTGKVMTTPIILQAPLGAEFDFKLCHLEKVKFFMWIAKQIDYFYK